MKKFAFLLIIASAVLFSCKKALEEKLISGISYGFYETPEGIEGGLTAAYTSLRWGYSGETLHPLQELGTDTYQEGQDGGLKLTLNRYQSTLNPSFTTFYDFWSNYYTGISRANVVITSLSNLKAGMTEDQKNIRIGEARYLRGLYYFYLVQTFGKVPIITSLDFSAGTDFKRSPVPQLYDLIISDLKFASEKLPLTQKDYGRATRGAAQHLLALAYLTRGSAVNENRGQKPSDLDSAAYLADQVIASNVYKLVPDFKALWNIDNQKNEEVIFAVQYSQTLLYNNNVGNWIHLFYTMVYDNKPGMLRDVQYGRPYRRVRPTDFTMYDLFDKKNDSRFYKTFKTVWHSNNPNNIPKWAVQGGFTPPADLVGKPKFKVGDTAIWITMERLSPGINKDSVYASRPYYYIPRDRQTDAEFPQNFKFYDNKRPAANEQNGTRDFFVFRLAETYLIAAEAYGRKGNFVKAAERLNEVRKRAAYKAGEEKTGEFWRVDGGNFNDRFKSTESDMLVTPAGLSTGSFVDFMLDERAREMHGECNRWWDLVRAEKLFERVKKYNPEAAPNIKPLHKLRPIPQNHIDRLNPKGKVDEEQNEGYY
ncbi:MAG: hypothetical protein JWQ40_2721 [Segetibacter sp.]|nr:hypothetical protein [Segetibacter sp.]